MNVVPKKKIIPSLLCLGLGLGGAVLLTGCGGGGDDTPVAPRITKASCEALVGTVIPKAQIGTLNGGTPGYPAQDTLFPYGHGLTY